MKLVYTSGPKQGQEVKVGDLVEINGDKFIITNAPKPHKPNSSGKVSLKDMIGISECEYYVGVIGAEWIEREDRQEFYTVNFEKRLSDGEHDNDFKVFDSARAARDFANNDWVLSPRIFKSDEDGNEI